MQSKHRESWLYHAKTRVDLKNRQPRHFRRQKGSVSSAEIILHEIRFFFFISSIQRVIASLMINVICNGTYLTNCHQSIVAIILKSIQNGVAKFNYFPCYKELLDSVLSLMIYCLIFSILYVPFKQH